MKKIKKPELIPDWKEVIKHTWEFKFYIISGICDVGEIILVYYPEILPRGAMVGVSGVFALAGMIARIHTKGK